MADVCIESLAPSSVDYKFVRQFVGEGEWGIEGARGQQAPQRQHRFLVSSQDG